MASDLPFLRNVITSHDLGTVATLDSPQSYAEVINSVLMRPDGGAVLRANLRKAAPLYTWSAQAGKLVLAYKKFDPGPS